VASIVGAVLLGLIAYNARYGAVSPRIRNPGDTGRPHRLSDPLFGYSHWIVTIEIFSYLALVSIVALIVVAPLSRPSLPIDDDRGQHPRMARRPDELGDVRRVQPRLVALARGLAHRLAVSDH
jgi:hypothetical protein